MIEIKRNRHDIQFIFLKNVIGYHNELEFIFNDSIMSVNCIII